MMEELSVERRAELIEHIAQQITKLGMTTPAIFFLEMNRPVTFLGSQAMHFFSPIASLIGISSMQELAYLFEDRANVEALLQRLEVLAAERT